MSKKELSKEELTVLKLKEVMEEIGFDTNNESRMGTPKRVLKVWREFMQNEGKDCSKPLEVTFQATGFNGILIVKDIEISALCEHHLLCFQSLVSIVVKLKDRVPGLSKYARTVQLLGNRITMQERISAMCMKALIEKLNPTAALVYMKSIHTCCACRSVTTGLDSPTITLQTMGQFDNPANLNIALNLLK